MNSEKQNAEESKNSKLTKIKFSIIAITAIIIVAMAISPVILQNDTFYTIKIGEHIVNTKKVDMVDPFSWHNDLAYTYPHWLYDVFIYLIYAIGGFKGIYVSTIILASILGITMYFTNCKITKNRPISFLITLGSMYLLQSFIAARAQLVTFILLELVILCIENFLEKKKVIYAAAIVLISTIIANVHCAVWPFLFVLFLPYIGEYLIFTILDWYPIYRIKKQIIKFKFRKDEAKLNERLAALEKNHNLNKQKREEAIKNPYKIKYNKNTACKWLIVIMIVCAFTGLLTPLGDTPYTYLVKTMQGNTTKSISEHLPLILIEHKPMLIVLAAIIAILVFTDAKITLKDLFMLGGLALLMFMTRRQASMFVLFGSAIVAKIIANLLSKYAKDFTPNLEKLSTTVIGTLVIFAIVCTFSANKFKSKMGQNFINPKTYPVQAAQWIKENLDISSIRLYNEYNYGSYLLFEGIPVFIDSRADLYAPEFNKRVGEESGRDIFSDYINTSQVSTDYEKTFEKYDITHIILYKKSKTNMLLKKDKDYKELYADDNFVIYERDVTSEE